MYTEEIWYSKRYSVLCLRFVRVLKNDAIYTNTLFPVDGHIYINIKYI